MPWHIPTPRVVSHSPHDPVRAGFPYLPEGMGWHQKVPQWCYLSTSTTPEGAVGERVYGLAMGWVHPYQARVSMIDDAAKQLTQLTSTGPNWPYALVWLNGDAHHMLLPDRGSLECYDGGEYQQHPLWKDLPIAGLPTSELRLLGALPRRTQWVSSSSDNVSVWVTI